MNENSEKYSPNNFKLIADNAKEYSIAQDGKQRHENILEAGKKG